MSKLPFRTIGGLDVIKPWANRKAADRAAQRIANTTKKECHVERFTAPGHNQPKSWVRVATVRPTPPDAPSDRNPSRS